MPSAVGSNAAFRSSAVLSTFSPVLPFTGNLTPSSDERSPALPMSSALKSGAAYLGRSSYRRTARAACTPSTPARIGTSPPVSGSMRVGFPRRISPQRAV